MCQGAIQNLLANRLRARLLELRARPRLLAERCHRERRRHVVRLRGVERGADVQRGPERAIDLLLDAALPHAKVRCRPGAVADALVQYETTLLLRHQLCQGLIRGGAQTRDDIADALESIMDAFKRFQRVFGVSHPHTNRAWLDLLYTRNMLTEDEPEKIPQHVKDLKWRGSGKWSTWTRVGESSRADAEDESRRLRSNSF